MIYKGSLPDLDSYSAFFDNMKQGQIQLFLTFYNSIS